MERVIAQQHDHLYLATLQVLDSIRMNSQNPLRPRQEGVYQKSGRYGNCKVGYGGTNHVDCKDYKVGDGGTNHVDCCPACVSSLSLLKQSPAVSPSLFSFSQAWIWKWSLDSASGNSSTKGCFTGQYILF